MDESTHQQEGRRSFFRSGIARLMAPLADLIDRHADGLRSEPRRWLRPPGAIPEEQFLEACYRCGTCADVCPAQAISLVPTGHKQVTGTPFIDPDVAACVVCEGLHCTRVCASGALRKLTDPLTIAMGKAEVYAAACLRSSREDCTICVDRCPIGPGALVIEGDGPPTVLDACVGCGVCQHYCPTQPKAITVKPA